MIVKKKRIGKYQDMDLIERKLIPTEYQECKAFWQYACRAGFSDDLIKNANERIQVDGGWFIKALYAIGFRKGLLDYQLIRSNEKYHTLWIEMKRIDQRNIKKRPEQDEWIERLLRRGHYAAYAYGCDDAIRIYKEYINNEL